VVEVHGSIRSSSCLGCGASYPLTAVLPLVEETGVPRCERCGAVLKPDVVFFGELMPVEAMNRASQLAREAALLLVVGSSLEVYPVAGLPQETLEWGGAVAIVNRGTTPYDSRAEVRIDGSAGEVLTGVVSRVRVYQSG
jgi:NAD-dependent deacetylase